MCDNCRHCIYDYSTGAYICKCEDDLTDNDVKCFENNTEGCSCFEDNTEEQVREDKYFRELGAFLYD